MVKERPPVIVVVGHIDHGKSTLLDHLRQTHLVDSEVGGITQHIGAYEVKHRLKDGREKILTFIDTPGHAAFNEMRRRGANLADLAVLIISAEEGVKPQTVEALAAIEQAKLPFVVAINKIDRPEANPDRVKQELAERQIFLEGYGGTVPVAEISAKIGTGVSDLLELLVLSAELAELKGDTEAAAAGFVLESRRDRQSGVIANLIIKNGTLRLGDYVVAGQANGKLRSLRDSTGATVKSLTFSAPAETLGWSDLPLVGTPFTAHHDKKGMERTLTNNQNAAEPKAAAETATDDNTIALVPIIVKGDTAGTSEAAAEETSKASTERVRFRVVGRGVGPINESDVKAMSATPGGLILGFGVTVEKNALELASKFKVAIQNFKLIYELSEWLGKEAVHRRPKVKKLTPRGRVKLLRIFNQEKGRQVVGGVVVEGAISEGEAFNIIRRESEIGTGKITGLEQQKLKAKTVEQDKQFGALVETKITLAPNDQLQTFVIVEE